LSSFVFGDSIFFGGGEINCPEKFSRGFPAEEILHGGIFHGRNYTSGNFPQKKDSNGGGGNFPEKFAMGGKISGLI